MPLFPSPTTYEANSTATPPTSLGIGSMVSDMNPGTHHPVTHTIQPHRPPSHTHPPLTHTIQSCTRRPTTDTTHSQTPPTHRHHAAAHTWLCFLCNGSNSMPRRGAFDIHHELHCDQFDMIVCISTAYGVQGASVGTVLCPCPIHCPNIPNSENPSAGNSAASAHNPAKQGRDGAGTGYCNGLPVKTRDLLG